MITNLSKSAFLNFVHPLLITHDDYPEFPYSQNGTGFLVVYQGRIILVSAKHCFEKNGITGSEVCIPNFWNDGTFLAFDRISLIQPTKTTDDADFTDLVLMRVKPRTTNPAHIINDKDIRVFPMTPHFVISPDAPNIQSFIVAGFPNDLNPVDHEGNCLPRKRLILQAKYKEPDGSAYIHVLEIQTEYMHHRTNGIGMSGGVAIAHVKSGNRVHLPLAGIIIRGFHGSPFARVLDARVLLHVIKQAAHSRAL